MTNKRTGTGANALIWFGAGVSLAEILTGTYYAGMGMLKGLGAILLGHAVGAVLMLLCGLIGGEQRESAMETVKRSFGRSGARIFAFLNVAQLLGWTAIMIYDGALAANEVFAFGRWIWALVIGGLIIVWIAIGIENLGKLSTVSMAALFLLSLLLFYLIFFKAGQAKEGVSAVLSAEAMSFGAGVELAVAMPLSWLPLISDYTREARDPRAASAVSVITYSLVSIFMYVIGMGAAEITGESSIAQIMLQAGAGAAGLLIIVLSTVTTTFLDAFSAGVSAVTVSDMLPEKGTAITAAGLGTIGAMLWPMDDITGFLYLIGSVFAPMAAIQITDYFILRRAANRDSWDIRGIVLWLLGFVLYRLMMRIDTPLGSTLPTMLMTAGLTVFAQWMCAGRGKVRR